MSSSLPHTQCQAFPHTMSSFHTHNVKLTHTATMSRVPQDGGWGWWMERLYIMITKFVMFPLFTKRPSYLQAEVCNEIPMGLTSACVCVWEGETSGTTNLRLLNHDLNTCQDAWLQISSTSLTQLTVLPVGNDSS